MVVEGRPLGAINLFSKQIRIFEAEDIELAQTFGHQAAIAVRNAQIVARERQLNHFERLIEKSKGLPPRDRHTVEHLLRAAERMIELATRPDPGYVRALLDGQWLQDAPIQWIDQHDVG
jgi:GAF domain-containing protein